MTDSDELVLVARPQSATWRRRLGPLAWTALECLALSAYPDSQGWAAPVGVRGIAAKIGVTKDTAARAVMTLITAGVITRQPVTGPEGQRRSGYRLHLPEGLELRPGLGDQYSRSGQQETGHCPIDTDGTSIIGHNEQDTVPDAASVLSDRERNRLRRVQLGPEGGPIAALRASQSTLFNFDDTAPPGEHGDHDSQWWPSAGPVALTAESSLQEDEAPELSTVLWTLGRDNHAS